MRHDLCLVAHDGGVLPTSIADGAGLVVGYQVRLIFVLLSRPEG